MRPISLTNYEYRIYTKILADRMKIISSSIIGDHQTCSVKNRRIHDNIILLRDMIFDANDYNKEIYIVSIDQSKAFDRVNHNYLFNLLKHMNFGEFIFNSIKRMYKNSFMRIIVNNSSTGKIFIKNGLKQGDAFSMFLYILANEELLVRIDKNPDIKGYLIRVYKNFECKAMCYADDNTGILREYKSIKLFFEEFNKWRASSGAQINKNKSSILAIIYNAYEDINFANNIKILGINFNKKGVCKSNIIKIFENIEKAIGLWSHVKLNIIERVVACKTFILSKVWYISNFIEFENNQIAKIKSLMFKFIWNNSIEMIKRDTLILPYHKGGLNCVSIEAKIETICLSNYINICENRNRLHYQFSVRNLKFIMRPYIDKGFNSIPVILDRFMPKYYLKMKNIVSTYISENETFQDEINKINRKKIYDNLVEKYAQKPKIESYYIYNEWINLYTRIHKINANSNVRAFLYKLLYQVLPCNQRFNNRNKIACFLCQEFIESEEHLFYECGKMKKLFEIVRKDLVNPHFILKKKNFWFSETIDKIDFETIAKFLYTIWILRNKMRIDVNTNIDNCFQHTYRYITKVKNIN